MVPLVHTDTQWKKKCENSIRCRYVHLFIHRNSCGVRHTTTSKTERKADTGNGFVATDSFIIEPFYRNKMKSFCWIQNIQRTLARWMEPHGGETGRGRGQGRERKRERGEHARAKLSLTFHIFGTLLISIIFRLFGILMPVNGCNTVHKSISPRNEMNAFLRLFLLTHNTRNHYTYTHQRATSWLWKEMIKTMETVRSGERSEQQQRKTKRKKPN